MIKLLFTFFVACICAITTFAQDTTSAATPTPPGTEHQKNGESQIAISELPETIRASLTRQDYIGWAVGNAFKKEKGGKTVYSVEMKKGSETRILKFDADGKKLNDKKE
jgi:hypothetical protein